jgi:hypothetical protein
MALVNAGRDFIAQAIVNAATPTFFNNANAYIGVGDSSTAYAAAQTDLQAASNKLRRGMQASYPTRTTNVLVFQSVFDVGDANWVWNEWAVFNASAAGTMLSRKQENLGTKTSAAVWQLTVTLTVNIGT